VIGVLLPALFDFSRCSGWDRALGDLSYPLYLVHWPVVAFAASMIGAIHPGAIGTVVAYPMVAIALAVGLAAVINRYVVDPLDRWRQFRVK
jgi:peptidoglycan/LPS O-acetylase OafA/YrhL